MRVSEKKKKMKERWREREERREEYREERGITDERTKEEAWGITG